MFKIYENQEFYMKSYINLNLDVRTKIEVETFGFF